MFINLNFKKKKERKIELTKSEGPFWCSRKVFKSGSQDGSHSEISETVKAAVPNKVNSRINILKYSLKTVFIRHKL